TSTNPFSDFSPCHSWSVLIFDLPHSRTNDHGILALGKSSAGANPKRSSCSCAGNDLVCLDILLVLRTSVYDAQTCEESACRAAGSTDAFGNDNRAPIVRYALACRECL